MRKILSIFILIFSANFAVATTCNTDLIDMCGSIKKEKQCKKSYMKTIQDGTKLNCEWAGSYGGASCIRGAKCE